MKRILFIGNFLSHKRGTKGIAERIAERKNEFSGYTITLTSYHTGKVRRFLDVIYHVTFARYDLVVIDVYSGAYFFLVRVATFLAAIRKKCIVLNLHGGKLHELQAENPTAFAQVADRASKIITPSLFLKQHLATPKISIEYLPNFIDVESFPYQRNVKANTVLWVRAFVSIYNPTMAIQVFAKVREVVPEATLTMIGPDHGELAACKALINELGLNDAVTLFGKVKNEELRHYYNTHAAFLNTTSYESFGLAVLEAASCGVPIVSNRVGEIPYLWKENEEMLMCDQGNVIQMAAHVVTLLTDSVYAQSLSRAARQKAEHFAWITVKNKWLKVFEMSNNPVINNQ